MLDRIVNSIDAQGSELEKQLLNRLHKQCGHIIDGMRKLKDAQLESEASQAIQRSTQDLRSKIDSALNGQLTTSSITDLYSQTLKQKNDARALLDTNIITLKNESKEDEIERVESLKKSPHELDGAVERSQSRSVSSTSKLMESISRPPSEQSSRKPTTVKHSRLHEVEEVRGAIEESEAALKSLLMEINKNKDKMVPIKELRALAEDKSAPNNKAAVKLLDIIFNQNKLPTKLEQKILTLGSEYKSIEGLVKNTKFNQETTNQYNDVNFNLVTLKSAVNSIQIATRKLLEQVMTKDYLNQLALNKPTNVKSAVKQRNKFIDDSIARAYEIISTIKASPAIISVLQQASLAVPPPSISQKVMTFFNRRNNKVHPAADVKAKENDSAIKNNFMDTSKKR